MAAPTAVTFTRVLSPEVCVQLTLSNGNYATPATITVGPVCKPDATGAAPNVAAVTIGPTTTIVSVVVGQPATASAAFSVNTATSRAFRPAAAAPGAGGQPIAVWADVETATLTFSNVGPGAVVAVTQPAGQCTGVAVAATADGLVDAANTVGLGCGQWPDTARVALSTPGSWFRLGAYTNATVTLRTVPFFVVSPAAAGLQAVLYTPQCQVRNASGAYVPDGATQAYTLLVTPDGVASSAVVAATNGVANVTTTYAIANATRYAVTLTWVLANNGVATTTVAAGASGTLVAPTLPKQAALTWASPLCSATGDSADRLTVSADATLAYQHVRPCQATLRLLQRVVGTGAAARRVDVSVYDVAALPPAAAPCTLTNTLLPQSGTVTTLDLTALVTTYAPDGSVLAPQTALKPGATMSVPCPFSTTGIARVTPSFVVSVPALASAPRVIVPPPWDSSVAELESSLAPTPSASAPFFVVSASAATPSRFLLASAMPQLGNYGEPEMPLALPPTAMYVRLVTYWLTAPSAAKVTLTPSAAVNVPVFGYQPAYQFPGSVFAASPDASVTITSGGATLTTSAINMWWPIGSGASLVQSNPGSAMTIAARCWVENAQKQRAVVEVLPCAPVYILNSTGVALTGTTARWAPETALHNVRVGAFSLAAGAGMTVYPFKVPETPIIFDEATVSRVVGTGDEAVTTLLGTTTVLFTVAGLLNQTAGDTRNGMAVTPAPAPKDGLKALTLSIPDTSTVTSGAAPRTTSAAYISDVCSVRGFGDCIGVAGAAATAETCPGYFADDAYGRRCRDTCSAAGPDAAACDAMVDALCGAKDAAPTPEQREAPECACALATRGSTVPGDFSGLVPTGEPTAQTYANFLTWFKTKTGTPLPEKLVDSAPCWWPACAGGFNAAPQRSDARCDNSSAVINCFASIGSFTTDSDTNTATVEQNCKDGDPPKVAGAGLSQLAELAQVDCTAVHAAKTSTCIASAGRPSPNPPPPGWAPGTVPAVEPNPAVDGKTFPPPVVPPPALAARGGSTPSTPWALTTPITATAAALLLVAVALAIALGVVAATRRRAA